jgi:hypothetical protein
MAVVQETDDRGKAPVTQAVAPHPAANMGGVYYTETIYCPILGNTDALSACNHKAYGVLNAGLLCRDFAAHSCYEETI